MGDRLATVTPVHTEEFWHDGRGPQLHKVHYDATGVVLQAIDYSTVDEQKRHLLFLRTQVMMLTPEEVVNDAASKIDQADFGKAALFCLGRSKWLLSFAQTHLRMCRHFRLMFYDEVLDVICEDIAVNSGCYVKVLTRARESSPSGFDTAL